ncbi:hypothetical protein Mal64_19150 [Pseudobythopirellula maris]|uniref:Zinc-ribbon domain-containing protein n=1 Tax=Pseudobythopirellula maris TaxID=2527991 RepID=A0A5C5ZLV2_9BACT|nr:zinc ribbon domain-containing protein [Pseudobythopirellula maris]TWT88434.1 hypothetical protein Mal64_19150 [Pseudobythopirellula maris]
MATNPCRDCGNGVSPSATTCPQCGAPRPSDPDWDGYGFEYKSPQVFLGLPLVHISFKYRENRMPVFAKGWLAVGQFSCGFFNLSQFGVGPFAVSQFALAGMAISQICVAVEAICQIGLVWQGTGQLLFELKELL